MDIKLDVHEKRFFSSQLKSALLESAQDLSTDPKIKLRGKLSEFENEPSLKLVAQVFSLVKEDYQQVIKQREKDRHFIDQRCKSLASYNLKNKISVKDHNYQTVLGLKDEKNRIPFGPLRANFYSSDQSLDQISLPDFLDGFHVTLFGPPGKEKMCINAMNAFHRQHPQEPAIVETLLQEEKFLAKWGADDEDSKTPLHSDLVEAGANLKKCYEGELSFEDGNKNYALEKDKLLQPIKRIPGLALPCTFLFHEDVAIPLHIYDFVLHLFHHYQHPQRLAFYIPKLENEEEAAYFKKLIQVTAQEIRKVDSSFEANHIRLFIVMENPRAIFRLNEIIRELSPHFAGASLGWHDFLASTARLFKHDSQYRIPVKADPNIVIKYIKASHELVANVVGDCGGIPIGGMYGVLPAESDFQSASFQLTMLGFFKDVITQLKRGLKGFWVAHPDFVRLGQALTRGYEKYQAGDEEPLLSIFSGYLTEDYYQQVKSFLINQDISGLETSDQNYARSLIVADIEESNFIANNDPQEIEYNVFQSLQYLTDWLCGNGCVALPAHINQIPVRVMDDLATAERSRWELWHEINHGRFCPYEFIRICHREMNFIRKNLSTEQKKVQVKYTPENAKWYEVSLELLIRMVVSQNPVEFLPELLIPFTFNEVRDSDHPWQTMQKFADEKYLLERKFQRYHFFFEMCGIHEFAMKFSTDSFYTSEKSQKFFKKINFEQLLSAASYHGDIGQNKATLDAMATQEQSEAEKSDPEGKIRHTILQLGQEYKNKFGVKFLISAKGKSSSEMLQALEKRLKQSTEQELEIAKKELLRITDRRVSEHSQQNLTKEIQSIVKKYDLNYLSLASSLDGEKVCSLNFDHCEVDTDDSKFIFQMASLSKTVASYFTVNLFENKNISLDTPVLEILQQFKSSLQVDSITPSLTIRHLMKHSGMNMHYVNGLELKNKFPVAEDLLSSPESYQYQKIKMMGDPGRSFQYSGGGFILLEYILGLIIGEDELFSHIDQMIHQLGVKTFVSNPAVRVESIVRPQADTKTKSISDLGFPSFAAGMRSHPSAVLKLLQKITRLYHASTEETLSDSVLSAKHKAACQMLHGQDYGSREFMHSKAGLGTFIIEGEKNYFMIHQGANDGYRSFYLYCFKGADQGFGFSIFSSGEEKAVLGIAEISQLLLKSFNIRGVDFNQFAHQFDNSSVQEEERVNRGYKELFLKAFSWEKAQTYPRQQFITDSFEEYNLLKNVNILSVSDEKFAAAENLFSGYAPEFDKTLFGPQGKVMDSWESSRHSLKGFEELIFRCDPISPEWCLVSTQFHDGNHVEEISIQASDGIDFNQDSHQLLEKVKLKGNILHLFKLSAPSQASSYYKIKVYPDGGLTRVKFFNQDFLQSTIYQQYFSSSTEFTCAAIPMIAKGYGLVQAEEGLSVENVSNEHYAAASSVISVYDPLDMFDGCESARSRKKNNFESFEININPVKKINKILLDFSFFVNNNPVELSIEGKTEEENWIHLLEKEFVKPYRGNTVIYEINSKSFFKKLRFKLFPDGGINRVKIL